MLSFSGGSTDASILVFIQDTSDTEGAGLTGVAFGDITCFYCRVGSADAELTLKTVAVAAAHDDGGFIEIDATDLPGVYRLDLSDAIVASGVDMVVVLLKGADDMAPVPIGIQIT